MAESIQLRAVQEADLGLLFQFQTDVEANQMAAFTSKNPADQEAFLRHWRRILANPAVLVRVIWRGDQLCGSVLRYTSELGPEVSYWISKSCWGQGVATVGLRAFLGLLPERPIFARVAADNRRSLRVLEKNGFVTTATERSFAEARGAEIEEFVLRLD